MKVMIRSTLRVRRINHTAVSRFAECVMEKMGLPSDAVLSILFAGGKAMRRLNREYRGVDRDTDVLAFPSGERLAVGVGDPLVGDIVISVDRARTHARRWGTTMNDELLLYLVHGILHCLGFRDDTPALRKKMAREQELILRELRGERRWRVLQ